MREDVSPDVVLIETFTFCTFGIASMVNGYLVDLLRPLHDRLYLGNSPVHTIVTDVLTLL